MPTRRLSDPPPEKETSVEATDAPTSTHNPPGDDVPGIVGAFGTAYGDSPVITEEPLMNEEDVEPTNIAPPHTSAPPPEPTEPPPTEEVPPETETPPEEVPE